MRIAIIGTGISGLTAGYFLSDRHELTLFEANDYAGGHTNTVDVQLDGERHAIDTGFIVFNDWTYPNFIALLDRLGVRSQPTEMSFSVRSDPTGLEYNGRSLNGLFAQRTNLLRPRFYRFIAEILRFNREAPRLMEQATGEPTVGEFLLEHAFSDEFCRSYLLPMGSAIWSCPMGKFAQFPMRFIVDFYKNHGLLNIWDRPQWRVIRGGSQRYVEALIRGFRDSIRLKTPVRQVRRSGDRVDVITADGSMEPFDHVIFACHSDQALRLLEAPSCAEREILGAFPYERNVAVLHTDVSLLPRRRRAWGAWNYHLGDDAPEQATVTYNMNILQGLTSHNTFCVTLNGERAIEPTQVIRKFVYHHPVFSTTRRAAQARHPELLGHNRSSFCGAYWGNGFHEDGVNSALAVCRAIDSHLRSRADAVACSAK